MDKFRLFLQVYLGFLQLFIKYFGYLGDTLFVAGCGRLFEGTAEQMHTALVDILGNLPDNTQVYCGHEYTVQNLKFAKHVEPDNPDVLNRIQWAQEKRGNAQPTVGPIIK